MAQVPGDPRILQRGGILDLDDVRKAKPAPQPEQPRTWRYFIETYEDGPYPIHVPIFVLEDGTHRMAIDSAFAPVSFLSLKYCRDFGQVMGWVEVAAPLDSDAASGDDAEDEPGQQE